MSTILANIGAVSTKTSVLSTLSTITSAVGKIGAGIAEMGARESAAKIALRKARWEEEKHRKEVKYLMGKQRLLYAKAGVDITSGSPLAFMAYTAGEGEREAQMIRAGGEAVAEEERRKGKAAVFKGITSFLTTETEKAYARER